MAAKYLTIRCSSCKKEYYRAKPKGSGSITFACKNCGEKIVYGGTTQGSTISQKTTKSHATKKDKGSLFQLNLTSKFLLFVLVPFLLTMGLEVYLNNMRMHKLETMSRQANAVVVRQISSDLIFHVSQNLAKQVRNYLYTHPQLKKEDFNSDIYFKKTVLQKIGHTGTTQLYERGNKKGEWIVWAHSNPAIVGKDLASQKREIGSSFDGFWKIITGVQNKKLSQGVYDWPGKNGKLQKRYAVNTSIDGTPFVVSASISLDEIAAPLNELERQTEQAHQQTRRSLLFIQLVGLGVIILIILLFGRSISSRIKRLSDWTDAISAGKLDVEKVADYGGDEISSLAKAIGRMQESIRISLNMLQKKLQQ